MEKKDFPGIQQAADEASIRSQRYYIRLMKWNLLAGISGALITVYNFEQPEPKIAIYWLSLLFLLTTLILTIIIKYTKYEDLWYQARALAESAKTLTWRYVTCSENFESTLNPQVYQRNFNDALVQIEQAFPDLVVFMDNVLLSKPSITNEMERVRQLSWQERLREYIRFRIDDQIEWYTTNAIKNKKKKGYWIFTIIVLQALSVASCFALILQPSTTWNLVGLFTTGGATAIAWLELKQFQSLVQAYTTASLELAQIKSLSRTLSDEPGLTRYVLDSENAISREHTLWLAQRRK